MKKIFLICNLVATVFCATAETIPVKNITELDAANKKAKPGDIIVLQNGNWNDVIIKLTCNGTAARPITVKGQQQGKVIINGASRLAIGGTYIIVDGLYFTNGFSGKEPVINFRTDSKQLANNCRVTNTAINNFNNPKRMDENYWVCFYGKNNRLDHCSFRDKNNMGVLLAVILDDDRSRENFHSIDHNYFGRRLPLASNSGEIIRVGVSQHCEFNSNTQIHDNYFEHCDGETEIISIKSCSNVVRGNLFRECQGGVVLRHGNYNTVENNIFLGNGKQGTGGVRVINKGQWVVNNFFYKCKGVDFRSPLSVMNGIPNSPANRYVQVTDAVIAQNTFYDCSSVSFCEGSDAERTLPPDNVWLINNIFYNQADTIYRAYDKMNGFEFRGNHVSEQVGQSLPDGFIKTTFAIQKNTIAPLPFVITEQETGLPDSLQKAARERLQHLIPPKSGFADVQLLKQIEANAKNATGAKWFVPLNKVVPPSVTTAKCLNADQIYKLLDTKKPLLIELSAAEYTFTKPLVIASQVQFTSKPHHTISFKSADMGAIFIVTANGELNLKGLAIDGKEIAATHFIASDSAGYSAHYNVVVRNCSISNLGTQPSSKDIFYAYKYMTADSIVFRNNSFSGKTNGIIMNDEKDDKGYYNAEKITINSNYFNNLGTLLIVYRGGNDESTMGPQLSFTENNITACNTSGDQPLISFTGVQVTNVTNNLFSDCNRGKVLVSYKDTVRARHFFGSNKLENSGTISGNQFLTEINTK